MKQKTNKQKLKDECIKIATNSRLEEHPNCMFCNQPAYTCHHFIHQSRSNYLKCDKRNLIPICKKCHYRLHQGGCEQIMTLQLTNILGEDWKNEMLLDSRKSMNDSVFYWKNMKESLI